MKLLTLTLALAPLRAHANGRLARYARNSTSHPGRCDRNVFDGLCGNQNFYGAFVLNHRVVLHAIDATPAR